MKGKGYQGLLTNRPIALTVVELIKSLRFDIHRTSYIIETWKTLPTHQGNWMHDSRLRQTDLINDQVGLDSE
jgi:hypothetical protein